MGKQYISVACTDRAVVSARTLEVGGYNRQQARPSLSRFQRRHDFINAALMEQQDSRDHILGHAFVGGQRTSFGQRSRPNWFVMPEEHNPPAERMHPQAWLELLSTWPSAASSPLISRQLPAGRKEGADWRGVKLREHCINDDGEPFPRLGGSSQRLVAPSHRRPIQSVKIAVVEMVAHRLPHLVESRSLDRRSARLAMNRPSTQCGKATEGQGAPARDAYVAHDDATANRCTCQVQRQDDRFVSGLFCRHAKLGRSQRSQL